MKAKPLIIPDACLKQHIVTLGKTGAGKSSALRHLSEALLEAQKRVCVIDPKGDWHGLTSSADGKGEGFPVLMFGAFKNGRSDVPMDGRSGKVVGEIVAKSKEAFVLGFRGWMPGDLTNFWIDFASTIFNHNAGELHLVIDEVHNFAPKGKVLDPQAGKCLHWTNRLASEGRGLNIKLLIASQRPQKVHNDTLTSCETLIAMRVIHEADRSAIKEWIDGCGDKEHGRQVLADLAGMKRGEAWVWSPEVGFLKRVTFPMFTTFDSFSENANTAPKKFAAVNVDRVREQLARVIDEAKAKDPKELQARVHAILQRLRAIATLVNHPFKSDTVAELDELVAAVRTMAAEAYDKNRVEPAVKEVSVFTENDRSELENLSARLALTIEAANNVETAISQAMNRRTPEPARLPVRPIRRTDALEGPLHPPVPRPTIPMEPRDEPYCHPPPTNGNALADFPKGERAVLIAVAQHPQGVTREQLSILTGYKKSTRDLYIQKLLQKGYIAVGPTILASEIGKDALGSNYEPLPTGNRLCEYWVARLPGGERRVLEEIVSAWPNAISRDRISEGTGYKKSTRDLYIQKLAARKLITTSAGQPKAADELFDETDPRR